MDVCCQQIFAMLEAFPRFKDLAMDPLRPASEAPEQQRGGLLFTGPLKMLQTIAMITQAGKASTAADRFKPLLSKSKWMEPEALIAELADAAGTEGLQEQLNSYDPANQYVVVLAAQLGSGGTSAQYHTGSGSPTVQDFGPAKFVMDHGRERVDRMPGFNYAGSLRPARVTPDRSLPESILRPDYWHTGQPRAEAQHPARDNPPLLTPEQIGRMRTACVLGREILDAAHRAVRPGVTTDEIDRVVHEAHVEAGAYPAPLHYHDFPKSVCTSVNEVVCHGIPDLRELQEGDIVNVDVSPILDGVHSDLNETFCVGNVDPKKKALIKATHDALFAAIDMCKPGTLYRDLGGAITKHVNAQGFAVDKTYCGHGIGECFHCSPNIPHYAGNKAKFVMKPGHCFTIEPMINAGSWKDTHWPDGWTAVTKDGQPSAQFEHTLLVNETGVEILTARLPTSPPLWWEAEGQPLRS
jgi:methionyl aminopeptidase